MEENQEKMFERIKDGQWKFETEDWSHISKEAKSLIRSLMNTNVDRRLTATEALHSKWIVGVSDKYLSDRDLTSTSRLIKDKKPRLKDLTDVFKALTSKAKTELTSIATNTIDNSRKAASAASMMLPSKNDSK